MKNKNYWYVVGLAIIGFVVAGILLHSILSGDSGMAGGSLHQAVSTSTEGQDLETVTSQSGDYSFALIPGWYLERNDGSGSIIYPNYDPSGTAQPVCKIEVSQIGSVDGSNLDGFVTSYLAADPTAQNIQISRNALTVSDQPAVEWHGSMNGETSTLVYVSAHGKVFEIAPSALNDASNINDDACATTLNAFLSTMNFDK
jgi:hypothetical protein